MSLIKLTYDQAIDHRRDPNSSWGDRLTGNRVEPIARPAFDVPFRFEPGEPIFTIGSCFARNVETKLKERGFGVPVRELFQRDEFRSLDPGLINNFGTPSILNEFRWALDPDHPFVEDENFVEVAPEKWVDLHVIPSIRPASLDVLRARRRGASGAAPRDHRGESLGRRLPSRDHDARARRTLVRRTPRPLSELDADDARLHWIRSGSRFGFSTSPSVSMRWSGPSTC